MKPSEALLAGHPLVCSGNGYWLEIIDKTLCGCAMGKICVGANANVPKPGQSGFSRWDIAAEIKAADPELWETLYIAPLPEGAYWQFPNLFEFISAKYEQSNLAPDETIVEIVEWLQKRGL